LDDGGEEKEDIATSADNEQGNMDLGHFENEDIGSNLDNIENNHNLEEINVFEARVFKMNERYFSTNEEDEIKDCDLVLDDEEINLEISAENTAHGQDIQAPSLITDDSEVQTSSTFFDNNFWKNNTYSEDEVMKELDIL
jgi:type IV secretory pathway VirD2 relaxase